MKISLLVIGKTAEKSMAALIDNYVRRINFYIPFEIIHLTDAKNTKNMSEEQQKICEGVSLLKKLESSDYVVLLDEHGKELTSMEFSRYIEKKTHNVPKRLAFVVGGPYGFSEDVKQRANEKISLSKMTFSHEMVRLFFVEQIYRAMTILNNEPYHHE